MKPRKGKRGLWLFTGILVAIAFAVGVTWYLGFGPVVLPEATDGAIEVVDTAGVRILPSHNYVVNRLRAPVAWLKARGEGTRVSLVNVSANEAKAVGLTAPDAEYAVESIDVDSSRWLMDLVSRKQPSIVVIHRPETFEHVSLQNQVEEVISSGVAIVVNGDTAKSRKDIAFVNGLEKAGALVVGQFEWTGPVIDPYAGERNVNVYVPREGNLGGAGAAFAAGVLALVKEVAPGLTPAGLKDRVVTSAIWRWQMTDPSGGRSINFRRQTEEGHWLPRRMLFKEPFMYRQLDAARAVGIELSRPWFLDALNIDEAQMLATGEGTRIAIIDQGFETGNPVLKGRIAAKAAFGGASFETDKHPHGTEMAEVAASIAPDAQLILGLCGPAGDHEVLAQAVAEAIDFAVTEKADVISMSWGPFANTDAVEAAIDRAISRGIPVVWFNYDGGNDLVIRPEPVSIPRGDFWVFDFTFARRSPVETLVGRSSGSPQAAGVIALAKEIDPGISPVEIKEALVSTSTVLEGGRRLLDAAAFVKAVGSN